jgi:hypothetical protein
MKSSLNAEPPVARSFVADWRIGLPDEEGRAGATPLGMKAEKAKTAKRSAIIG